jgi:hypothetical protein
MSVAYLRRRIAADSTRLGTVALADAHRPDKNQNNCSSTASKQADNPADAGFF